MKTWLFVARSKEQAFADAGNILYPTVEDKAGLLKYQPAAGKILSGLEDDDNDVDCCSYASISTAACGRTYDVIRIKLDVPDAGLVFDTVGHHLREGKYRIHYSEGGYAVVERRQIL